MRSKSVSHNLKSGMLETKSELILYTKTSAIIFYDISSGLVAAGLSFFIFYTGFFVEGAQNRTINFTIFIVGMFPASITLCSLIHALRQLKRLKGRIGAVFMKADRKGISFKSIYNDEPFGKCREWKSISRIILTKQLIRENSKDVICEYDVIHIFYPQKKNEVTEKIAILSSRTPEGMKYLKSDFPAGRLISIRESLQRFAEEIVQIEAAEKVTFNYEDYSEWITPLI